MKMQRKIDGYVNTRVYNKRLKNEEEEKEKKGGESCRQSNESK